MLKTDIKKYFDEVECELKENIIPFWSKYLIDKSNDGYYGWMSNNLDINRTANKGCILNSRILWNFSGAYKLYKNEDYLTAAKQAYDFMVNHFWDNKYSGLYWMVDYKGEIISDHKQIYNLAFGIYSLSEYYMASRDENSLKMAKELYGCIEDHGYDKKKVILRPLPELGETWMTLG